MVEDVSQIMQDSPQGKQKIDIAENSRKTKINLNVKVIISIVVSLSIFLGVYLLIKEFIL